MKSTAALVVAVLFAMFAAAAPADENPPASPLPTVPDGFTIEVAAGPPLVERPIVAAFDEAGHLYVAESSGSNDKVEKQLEQLPHRVVRLTDTDGDGKFDERTVFADRLMLPQGTLFYDGSLYVSAAPSIWKLTDTDGDGVADERSEWFQGKTLTGCANDLHGPYLGPDGWIYWCKGAFAEQTHQVHGREWKSRAAHIFRCRPDGTDLEPVITGGMDNPVDVTFTAEGEKILSATLIVGDGRRDGIVHAIYGGVYGKQHGVLEGHLRTGELMPALVLMSPTSPCGIERYDSDVFGDEFRDNLFVCQFNTRRVSRHILQPAGSTFASTDSDFVVSDNVDFHPTDVVIDADGSLLVIDTGGWYKLCCPTSTLWKPDVLGGIYRVRRNGAAVPDDPRGQQIDWQQLSVQQVWDRFEDSRPVVRQRALREMVKRRDSPELQQFLAGKGSDVIPTGADKHHSGPLRTWALAQLETEQSRRLVRKLLKHRDKSVRHAAVNAVGLHRDTKALHDVMYLLHQGSPAPIRRAAAEALGRIGDPSAGGALLSAAAWADDRVLQHSIVYALIEIGSDPAATRSRLIAEPPRTQAAAILALDQMPDQKIPVQLVLHFLNSTDPLLRESSRWLVAQHPEWGGQLAGMFRGQLTTLGTTPEPDETRPSDLEEMLFDFMQDGAIQQLLAETVASSESPRVAREIGLRLMMRAKLRKPPASWKAALTAAFADDELVPLAIAALREMPPAVQRDPALNKALAAVADAPEWPEEVRVAALAVTSPNLAELSDGRFELLSGAVAADQPVASRAAAADAFSKARLTRAQLGQLCGALPSAGPLELNQLLAPFGQSTDEELGLQLLASLKQSTALASVRVDLLREHLAKYGPRVHQGIDELESQLNHDAAAQRKHLEELAPLVTNGDVRRGHAVFHSNKAACSACHRLGNAGGVTGPALSKIGDTRTERDLLEAILYPSLSFVRSYEPVLIYTVDGKTINGIIRDETADEYVLAIGPEQEVRVPRDEVELVEPSSVSIMPAGLEKQLSTQELADLVAFLKNATDK